MLQTITNASVCMNYSNVQNMKIKEIFPQIVPD